MGTDYCEFTAGAKIETFSPEINDIERTNRLLLRAAMLGAGFMPFDGEWWHFMFNDKECACLTGQSYARYGPLSAAEISPQLSNWEIW